MPRKSILSLKELKNQPKLRFPTSDPRELRRQESSWKYDSERGLTPRYVSDPADEYFDSLRLQRERGWVPYNPNIGLPYMLRDYQGVELAPNPVENPNGLSIIDHTPTTISSELYEPPITGSKRTADDIAPEVHDLTEYDPKYDDIENLEPDEEDTQAAQELSQYANENFPGTNQTFGELFDILTKRPRYNNRTEIATPPPELMDIPTRHPDPGQMTNPIWFM